MRRNSLGQPPELNLVILDAELLEAEFSEFKYHLSNAGTQGNSIPCGKLENANRNDVVNLIVQEYSSSDAGKIAVRVLRKIKQNDLADQLKRNLQEVPEDVSAEGGASSGAAASSPGITVTINSTSGGTVKAPVVQGGVFHGPMNFS
ncbi:caspase b-like [Labeo rohita]|uniref:caspase b-like n=1 Tax=Labeo rohita TaxID=84645 RepID=UPI0021E23F41|nr:caspase b-like [Labeo rohita]